MVSASMKRTSREKGIELESKVKEFLIQNGFKPIPKKKVQGKCGLWELDIFLDTQPQVVIECKNPTSEARTPSDSIRRKAQEAFLALYDIKNNSDLRDAIFVLITGLLPLRPNPAAPRVRDYENFLRETLGPNFFVFSEHDLDRLLEVIPH
jgi:hypothetical protein